MVDDPIDVEAALVDANEDPRVHGIIVYYPIFGQEESFSGASQDDYLRDSVSYKCDVEGLCHTYRTNLYRNVRFLDYPANTKKCCHPCTALSVVKIMEQCPGCYDHSKPMKRKMEGKTVTVINRSEIVGRPLAAMLANDGADVYSVDINTIYLFRGGKLYKCPDETPESCVRKVGSRHGPSMFCICILRVYLIVLWYESSVILFLTASFSFSISFVIVFGSCDRGSDKELPIADRMDPREYDCHQCRLVQER
jgi:hypothetical protein